MQVPSLLSISSKDTGKGNSILKQNTQLQPTTPSKIISKLRKKMQYNFALR